MKISKITQILAIIVTLTFLSVPRVQAQTKYCNNPDGVSLEISTNGSGEKVATVTWSQCNPFDNTGYYVCVSTSPQYTASGWPNDGTVPCHGTGGHENLAKPVNAGKNDTEWEFVDMEHY